MKKPTQEIERLRAWINNECRPGYQGDFIRDMTAILAYLDSLPEWPADLTRERLEELANPGTSMRNAPDRTDALRRLAELAPKREKRKEVRWIGWHEGAIVMRDYQFNDAVKVEVDA